MNSLLFRQSKRHKTGITSKERSNIPTRRRTTCSQSAPLPIVVEQSFPSSAKSAERIEGAMMAGGDIAGDCDL